MTGRHELGELHALAEVISKDAHGWRRQRRERHLLRSEHRSHAELMAGGKRRNRHRLVAGFVVFVVAVGLVVTGVEIGRSSHHHAGRLSSIAETVPAYQLPDVQAGRQAAAAIASEGRASDVFSCQQWFDSHGYATDPAATAPGWHAEFMRSCLNASPPTGSDG